MAEGFEWGYGRILGCSDYYSSSLAVQSNSDNWGYCTALGTEDEALILVSTTTNGYAETTGTILALEMDTFILEMRFLRGTNKTFGLRYEAVFLSFWSEVQEAFKLSISGDFFPGDK